MCNITTIQKIILGFLGFCCLSLLGSAAILYMGAIDFVGGDATCKKSHTHKAYIDAVVLEGYLKGITEGIDRATEYVLFLRDAPSQHKIDSATVSMNAFQIDAKTSLIRLSLALAEKKFEAEMERIKAKE